MQHKVVGKALFLHKMMIFFDERTVMIGFLYTSFPIFHNANDWNFQKPLSLPFIKYIRCRASFVHAYKLVMAKKKKVAKKVVKKKQVSNTGWLVNKKAHLIFLFAVSFLLYANTFSHDYAQDDQIVIVDNMYTQDGIKGIPGILSKDTFYGFFKKDGKENLVAGGRYRPLTLVQFAIGKQIFGNNPAVGHIFNAIYYGLTIIVLYLVLALLFQQRFKPREATFIAFTASLIFAMHPIHVEAVANIKGRDETMALLLSLSALYLVVRSFLENNKPLAIWSGVLFFLGLMSKENTITFIAIIPFAFYFFTKADFGAVVKKMAPILVATVLFLAIRFAILPSGLGKESMELMNNPFLKIENGHWVLLSFAERLPIIFFTLGKYLELLFFPLTLTHDYYPRQIDIMTFGDWRASLSLIVYLAMGIYAIIGLKKKQPMAFAILFYLASLSIVSNIVFPVGTNMSERFAYMPSVGFALAIALLLHKLFGKSIVSAKVPTAWIATLTIIALLLGTKTFSRNFAWKDNFTLFSTDIQTSTKSAKLLNTMGGMYYDMAEAEQDPQKKLSYYKKSIGYLERTIQIHPTYRDAYVRLAAGCNKSQQYDKAIKYYKDLAKLYPDLEEVQKNIQITYREAGQYYGEQKGDLQKAFLYLNQAYQMDPTDISTIRLLGVAYGVSQQPIKAIEFFTKVTQIQPDNAGGWFDLGVAYMQAGDQAQGEAYIQKARAIDPQIDANRAANK